MSLIKNLLPHPSTRCRPRSFSVLSRPPPTYPSHIPLTWLERAALGITSGVTAYLSPRRADLIATFGELTSQPFFVTRLRDAMLRSASGRRILRERPRITSDSISRAQLRAMPPGSFGAAYLAWLDREGVDPDTRAQVRYVDDEECAYVMQRYRESHDMYHSLTGLPTVREGEVALKLFEWMNTGLPMTGLSVLNVATLKEREQERFWSIYGPWALRAGAQAEELICVYWEKELATDLTELRQRLGIEIPPDMREFRRIDREARKKEKEAKQKKSD